MPDIRNTADLRVMLLETIRGVKEKSIDPKEAHAIANLSSKVLQSAKLDLDVIRFNAQEGITIKAGEKVLQLVNQ